MKKLALILLFPIFAHASVTQASTPTYHYEVTLPNSSEVKHFSLKEGEQKNIEVLGKTTEYTKEMSEMSKTNWKILAEHDKLPTHDFVKCGKKTCWYGVKEQLTDKQQMVVKAVKATITEENSKSALTVINYDDFKVDNVKVIQLSGSPGMPMPETQTTRVQQSKNLKVGDAWITKNNNGQELIVRLVSIE